MFADPHAATICVMTRPRVFRSPTPQRGPSESQSPTGTYVVQSSQVPNTGAREVVGRTDSLRAPRLKRSVLFLGLLFPLLLGTGIPRVAAAETPFATSISSNHRYLLDQAGYPYMIVGDSAHSLSVDLSTTQMKAYFADRQAHGFNSVLVELICGQYTGNHNKNSGNYATYDGITPFTTNGDISTPNPAYFRRMQTMVRLAENDGITLFLDPADTGQLLRSSSFLAHNGAAKDYNYGRFLGRTFEGFPNIVWESGNDYQKWGRVNDA